MRLNYAILEGMPSIECFEVASKGILKETHYKMLLKVGKQKKT